MWWHNNMSVITKIAKNPSATVSIFIPQSGVNILPSSSYNIPTFEFPLWINQIDSLITAGTIIINDGITDLSVVNAIALMNGIPASYISFDNITNSFSSTKAQSAIEEAKATARGQASRYTVTFSQTGGTASGSYIRNSGGNPSNVNPFVVPESAKLIAISVSVSSLSVGTTAFSVIKNGSINIGTVTIPNGVLVASISGLSATLISNDTLAVECTSGISGAPVVNIFIQTN
jgi:hypothetical protein